MDLILPYKIGDLAEAKSYVEGYRGAWFRCKIHDMRVAESGHFECYLEYIDYPGENKEWIRLFHDNPACSKQQSTDQIMIRPSFPQWHWEDQAPEQFPDNDVVVIVHGSWEVGDMVDWFSEGCYWSGKITKLLSEDMLEVELLKPPTGEGQRYDANYNDLRPTLDWSLLIGWTVPLSKAKGKCWRVADVVHHKSTDSETSDSEEETSPNDGDKEDNGGAGGDSQSGAPSGSMHPVVNSSQPDIQTSKLSNKNKIVRKYTTQRRAILRKRHHQTMEIKKTMQALVVIANQGPLAIICIRLLTAVSQTSKLSNKNKILRKYTTQRRAILRKRHHQTMEIKKTMEALVVIANQGPLAIVCNRLLTAVSQTSKLSNKNKMWKVPTSMSRLPVSSISMSKGWLKSSA